MKILEALRPAKNVDGSWRAVIRGGDVNPPGHSCFVIHIYVSLQSSRNFEALASKVKHKFNILKTQVSKKYDGCELTIVAGNEFGKTVL